MVRTTVLSKAKATVFKLYAPKAKTVGLAGSFNNWDAKALSGKKDAKGNWEINVGLKPGKHEYKFFVDGSWVTDPKCPSVITNSFGTHNSVIEVK